MLPFRIAPLIPFVDPSSFSTMALLFTFARLALRFPKAGKCGSDYLQQHVSFGGGTCGGLQCKHVEAVRGQIICLASSV